MTRLGLDLGLIVYLACTLGLIYMVVYHFILPPRPPKDRADVATWIPMLLNVREGDKLELMRFWVKGRQCLSQEEFEALLERQRSEDEQAATGQDEGDMSSSDTAAQHGKGNAG